MAKRIICKVHNNPAEQIITHVGVEGEGTCTMLSVWIRINANKEDFYTLEENKEAKVYAREREGTKYLTSYPDGETPNNLDELKQCTE